jgi:hypothetical protein
MARSKPIKKEKKISLSEGPSLFAFVISCAINFYLFLCAINLISCAINLISCAFIIFTFIFAMIQ